MDGEWFLWIAVLIAWPLVGVGMAFLFTEIVRGAHEPEDATLPPKMTYLLHDRRGSEPLGASTSMRVRRVFGVRTRH